MGTAKEQQVLKFFKRMNRELFIDLRSKNMKIIHTQVSPFWTNVYIYYDENSKEAAIVDPGGDCVKLKELLDENKLTLKAILLTHGHFDHIGAVNELREITGAKVYAYEEEKALLASSEMNEALRIGRKDYTIECDKLLKEGDIIEICEGRLSVIHTPGHTAGGACFYDEENAILFAGDTLFKDSVGRYDLATASGEALFHSIKEKLFKLPDDTKVFPGHNSATTIGREKVHNMVVGSGR